MGTGGRDHARRPTTTKRRCTPGHIWMQLLTGPHVSTDLALVDGRIAWWRHTTGRPGPQGTFDYWTVHADGMPGLEALYRALDRAATSAASPASSISRPSAGGIIECHLRMADQWLDLNGEGWLTGGRRRSTATGRWRSAMAQRRTGYSVVLFGAPGATLAIDREPCARLRRTAGVSSIQITFDAARPPAPHAMPPGGFRLAIINCWDLASGKRVRAALRRLFSVAARLDRDAIVNHLI